MDKDLINDYRAVVLPVLQNILIKKNFEGRGYSDALEIEKDFNEILRLAEKALDSQWIPVTYRPMTEEEEKEFCETWGIKEGSLEDWEKKVFTCPLPDDGQEILTSFGRYVQEDICSYDEYGCGLENNGDWDGVDAWMPKPEPYKKGGENNGNT